MSPKRDTVVIDNQLINNMKSIAHQFIDTKVLG